MPVKLINHKSKEILLLDYSDCKTLEEMLTVLNDGVDLVRTLPGKGLHLIDITNAYGSRKYMEALKEAGKEVFNEKAGKVAIVGVKGVKKVLLMGYNKIAKIKLVPFETREEAMDYLVG